MPPLFSIKTDRVHLIWSQSRIQPLPLEPGAGGRPFGLRVDAGRRETEPVVRIHDDQVAHLFEQTAYTILVRSRTDQPVRLRHRDPVLLRQLHCSDDGRIVHGTLNFRSQVGGSRFVVEVDGTPAFRFEVEVVPSKLDYRKDYDALCRDLQDMAVELVLDYLRAAYQRGRETSVESSSDLAWVALLRHGVGELERALAYVTHHPQWGTQHRLHEASVHQVRRPDTTLRRAVLHGRGRGATQQLYGEVTVRERLPTQGAQYTLDTPEHRWLAAQLDHVRQRLGGLQRAEERLWPGVRRRQVIADLESLQHRIVRLTQLEPLRAAQRTSFQHPTLRLRTAPGYREAYQHCLLLRRGLDLQGQPVELELKDLHVLYEYWCFLTLVRGVAEETEQPLPLRQLVQVERYGLRLRLRKGRSQTVTFDVDGGRVALTYNPQFGGPDYLVPQQPDILLTVRAGDSVRHYVLDAKYRIDASPAYRRRYGLPGPPTDTLNDLHRYRDAIQDRQRPERRGRAVTHAVALYPYREPEPGVFAASRHGRALAEVGVGALPLLPGATTHLQAWLHDVLDF